MKAEQKADHPEIKAFSHMQRDPSSYYLSPPNSSNPLPDTKFEMMSTSHRGLPPPSTMDRLDRMDRVLPQPQPDRSGLDSRSSNLGSLPNAPSQWTGQDESMRTWLNAKSEEDRRKQEEEKTKQEGIRLEQRKIEQSMLQDSLRGGIPPPMVPMVFASMGGANVSNLTLEWAQHYMTQISLQQQQQQQAAQIQQHQQQHQQQQAQQQAQIQPSPDQRRDVRLITGPNPNPYGTQSMQPPSQNSSLQQQAQSNSTLAGYQGDRPRPQQAIQAAPPTSTPRSTNQPGALSRLNTNELQIQPPAAGLSGLQISGQHPLQQTQTAQVQDQASSSPTIYFHHYVPPGSQSSKDKDPGTPAMKNGSPHSQNAGSHRRSEYTTSPKKRKATGDHKPPPEPSPSFSQQSSSSGRRRQRSRHPSDASLRGIPDYARNRTDSSRQSLSEAESGRNSAQPETRHRYPAGSDGRESNQISRGSSGNSPQGETSTGS